MMPNIEGENPFVFPKYTSFTSLNRMNSKASVKVGLVATSKEMSSRL